VGNQAANVGDEIAQQREILRREGNALATPYQTAFVDVEGE